MKYRHLIWPLFALLLPLLFHGCSKDDYLPGLTGNMIGFVYTFDEFGSLLDDRSQVKVTAIGLDQNFSANSNSEGKFVLKDVPTGTYELHIMKKDFGTLKQFGVQHLGGKPTILLNAREDEQAYFLYKMPASIIKHLNIVNDSMTCVFTFDIIPNPSTTFFLKVYFSSENNFARQDAEYVDNARIWYTDGKYWSRFHFERTPFDPGETVYYKACRYTVRTSVRPSYQNWDVYGVDTYFNYELNETIFPNLGDESEQYSFTFPE